MSKPAWASPLLQVNREHAPKHTQQFLQVCIAGTGGNHFSLSGKLAHHYQPPWAFKKLPEHSLKTSNSKRVRNRPPGISTSSTSRFYIYIYIYIVLDFVVGLLKKQPCVCIFKRNFLFCELVRCRGVHMRKMSSLPLCFILISNY